MSKVLVVLVGPTASGKTDLALQLADEYRTEIISADSRQVFRELNIGVAKPTDVQLQKVKHHFVNHVSIQEDFNAGKFEEAALKKLKEIFQEKDVALLAGGTGLYIRALCEGMDNLPGAASEIRKQIIEEYDQKGIEYVQQQLKIADPEYYSKADLQNPQRLMRALEVFRVSGKPFSSFHSGRKKQRDFNIIKIGLQLEKEELHERINRRVDEMLEQGLVEEVKSVKTFQALNALQTVGYKELFDFIEGKTELPSAVELIKQNTRKYAKRQMTWFKKDKEIQWFHPEQVEDIKKYLRGKISGLA